MSSKLLSSLLLSFAAISLLLLSGVSSAQTAEEEELMQKSAPSFAKVYKAGKEYKAAQAKGLIRATPASPEEMRMVYNIVHKQVGHAHDPQKHSPTVLKSCSWTATVFCSGAIAAAVAACLGPEDIPCITIALGVLGAVDLATKGVCLSCLK